MRIRVSVDAIGWTLVCFLAALSLVCGLTAVARADGLTLAERIAQLVPRYGSRSVELVDAREFGEAVDTACKHDRECVARLVTMAIAESALSLDVSKSKYLPHQGDAYMNRDGVRIHRAAGTWQLHKNRFNADTWGASDLLTQAKDARAMQLGALAECRAFRGLVPELGMWRILSGGRGCLSAWPGEEARMTLLAKIRRAL